MDNYSKLIERISQSAKLSKDEIERKIEAKRAKLSGLVSREGAAQIVASELGINFEEENLKVAELVQGMKRAGVIGKIIELYPVRSFEKNGRSGKVANMILADETGNAKTVLWDLNHIGLIEQGKIKKGDTVEISRASVRNGEIHLSGFSDIKISNAVIKNVNVQPASYQSKDLKNIVPGERARLRAVIVQMFDPRYFEVCPECRKKAVEGECAVHGKITPVRRALTNAILDDGTETVRALLVDKELYALGVSEMELFSLEAFQAKKKEIIGEELYFSGNMKMNQLFNTPEFAIDKTEPVQVDALLKELQV